MRTTKIELQQINSRLAAENAELRAQLSVVTAERDFANKLAMELRAELDELCDIDTPDHDEDPADPALNYCIRKDGKIVTLIFVPGTKREDAVTFTKDFSVKHKTCTRFELRA